ncbi:MAG: methyltransferase [SAR324 cluster bacterium]|nr:methyltransferase [SAR324 cluster bacterium]
MPLISTGAKKSKNIPDLELAIAQRFSGASASYDQAATVQKTAALWLWTHLFPTKITGKILEVGCGTGILSEKIVAHYPKNEIVLSDLSETMMKKCRAQVAPHETLNFKALNGQDIQTEEEYAAIFTSFTLQWVLDLSLSLKSILKALKPKGVLVAAVQGAGSYPEWKAACERLNLPFLGNPLPRLQKIEEILKGEQIELHCEKITSHYPKAIDFFKDLKRLGASTSTSNSALAYKDFKALLAELDNKQETTMTTEVIYFKLTKS